MSPRLGFIAGSGLDDLGSQENQTENVDPKKHSHTLDLVSWGPPSSLPVKRVIGGREIYLLSRHGVGHHIAPHQVNYRGNISALKQCGVTHLVSFCAVGSLDKDIPPGTFVLVEQYIDRTKASRTSTFFEDDGIVAHVSLAEPTCKRLNDYIEEIATLIPTLSLKRGGQLVCIDGPQFSTRAEAKMHQAWGCNLVGMTSMTECRLAREAGLCFANIAMVTDYDCIPESSGVVSHHAVTTAMKSNVEHAKLLIAKVAEHFTGMDVYACRQHCSSSLVKALASAPLDTTKGASQFSKYRILNSQLFG